MSIFDNLYLYPAAGNSYGERNLSMEWRIAKYSDPSDVLNQGIEKQFTINDISDLEELPIYQDVFRKDNRLIMPNAEVARIFKHTLSENFSFGKFTDDEIQFRNAYKRIIEEIDAARVFWINSFLDSIKKENPDSEYLWTWGNFAKVSESIGEDLRYSLAEYFKKNGCDYTAASIDKDNHRDTDGYFPTGFIDGLQSYFKELRPIFTPDHIRYLLLIADFEEEFIPYLFGNLSEEDDDDAALRLLLSPLTAPTYIDLMRADEQTIAGSFFSAFAEEIERALSGINDGNNVEIV